MKFGQNLPRNQVPEWASAYIDYKRLKKMIKAVQQAVVEGEEPDLAGTHGLEDVDTFYNRKYAELSRRLRLLYEKYGMASKLHDGMDKDEMEDLMATLLELRGQYRKLQWYGEVNRRGFIKITKKLDKKVPSSSAQSQYLATKVDPKPFATNNLLTQDMRAVNDWLSSLGPAKLQDDASSVQSGSSGSLRRSASKSSLRLPPANLDALDSAVREDDTVKLLEVLKTSIPATGSESQRKTLLLDLLQRAISFRSEKSIAVILQRVPTLEHDVDMNKRNCLHRLVIAIGRARALDMSARSEGVAGELETGTYINAAQPPVRAPGALKIVERDPDSDFGKDDRAEKLLVFILGHLTSEQRSAIIAKDAYNRLPLHYSAQYGLVEVSRQLMRYMQDWKLFDISDGIDSAWWQDIEGYAPLHLAVIGGHYRTTKALLFVDDEHHNLGARLTHVDVEKNGASLALATKANFVKIVSLLVIEAGVDVNYQDLQGETALHVAARYGHKECMRILLDSTVPTRVDVELVETTYGWTPLFVACVDNQLDVAKLLVQHGAVVSKKDYSGWTPQEHAALRGHLVVADFLRAFTPAPSLNPSPEIAAQSSSFSEMSLEGIRSEGVPREAPNDVTLASKPVKTFGHRYLMGESMVLVSLGSMDNRKNLEAVLLENIALNDAHATQLDTALSLVVSAQGAMGEPTIIDVPVQENISTSPIAFTTKDPSKVKLLFDLVPTYAGRTDKVIGRAVALLSSIKPTIGAKRMNLQGDLSVPLVAGATLDIIGSVNFNFLIITPFVHPNLSVSEDRTYWKASATRIIGHRGLGKNMAPGADKKRSLQLGENTLDSFVTAASLGASYVEFDVQMTKDHIPVIYHDFLVSETGADVPVHSLTLEQFLALSEGGPRAKRQTKLDDGEENTTPKSRVQRSYSLDATVEDDRPDMRERMKHTRDFKKKGFKANLRGEFIQSRFTTLEEMFRRLPQDISFNIEMKYPMLFESLDEDMDTYAIELNSFVDTVLKMVYDLSGKRNLIFSSFHPDICLLLSFKQPNFPILFLTDAGTGSAPVGDIRASSLQEAIRFASRWNLLGIVSAALPFVLCPRLIQVVKNSGLVCVSYGMDNNDPFNSRLQAQEGIDAVIVDNVARVRKGLTEHEQVASLLAAGAVDGADAGGTAS
ncbi:Glycerophosphocholine phosphodiesterase [Friedmanniomyces endolithicus]|uniref:Glycerophosphocholine phosphodiesterase n=1 Tax=Friedmanniomyces endolithicus TaxID=329885 RepID=A0AAN6GZU5_9PEZI|nr:Glycerophosphocholine phosphodiesterase [Friedmanniomyces endolithicus]KAK0790810.1 Glycerophosphocholine phosphodiesterase [Friedmanniomyces endolithicus]KAK0798523.1 Glycerophosphocholine phosphodiesterase [Friedmanniomyces endolithicus]KAK0802929.1 Glycerophosphocholine phosphodiesterase [Friedmanniomyces endolithicus]KAK0842031.1 Glycerophosphocholine phosphodiesterase [Friedmanniomyces endolithicus]